MRLSMRDHGPVELEMVALRSFNVGKRKKNERE
jgi:hypothetical protein